MSDLRGDDNDILKCFLLCVFPGLVVGLGVYLKEYGLAVGLFVTLLLLALLGIRGTIQRKGYYKE